MINSSRITIHILVCYGSNASNQSISSLHPYFPNVKFMFLWFIVSTLDPTNYKREKMRDNVFFLIIEITIRLIQTIFTKVIQLIIYWMLYKPMVLFLFISIYFGTAIGSHHQFFIFFVFGNIWNCLHVCCICSTLYFAWNENLALFNQ